MKDRAVFLDRDGTIIEEVGYLSNPGQVSLVPGAGDALRRLKGRGFKLIVVTNQSGIARGYFGAGELAAVHEALDKALAEMGARVDAYYHCPHHPEHGERLRCSCRKPDTGMVERAAREHGVDLVRSYFVGDKASDVELGLNAGGKPALVLTGFGPAEDGLLKEKGVSGYMVFGSLAEAADWIIEDSEGSS